MKNFNGEALFLDRADINTDEIIPAKYLIEITKEALRPHLFEALHLDGFDPAQHIAGKRVVISRANFGCGSSREHAPWALETNGVNVVIAESFARIFRQNMFNGGMLAIELPAEQIEQLFNRFGSTPAQVTTDFDAARLMVSSGGQSLEFEFEIGAFNRDLVKAGGWVAYADQKY